MRRREEESKEVQKGEKERKEGQLERGSKAAGKEGTIVTWKVQEKKEKNKAIQIYVSIHSSTYLSI